MFTGELPGRLTRAGRQKAGAMGAEGGTPCPDQEETGGWDSGPRKELDFHPPASSPTFLSADQL